MGSHEAYISVKILKRILKNIFFKNFNTDVNFMGSRKTLN